MHRIMIFILAVFCAFVLEVSAENTAADEQTVNEEYIEISIENAGEVYDEEETDNQDGTAEEPNVSTGLIYAVESELVYMNGEVVNIWARPFVYDDTTYAPLRNTVEGLGGTVTYDAETEMIGAYYGDNHYSVWVNDADIRVFNGISFVPVRVLCETLGFTVDWYSGIIAISDAGIALAEDEIAYYKEILRYIGYKDAFLTPRRVVNPYTVYSYEQMNSDLALLERMYPELFWVYSIGKTTEGRDLTAFTFGRGETKIIICGSMHAREYIATNFIMYMVDTYALAYENNEVRDGYSFREALDNVKFIIIPMVNPDGINLVQNGFDSTQNPDYVKSMPVNAYGNRGWKATATGTDLNNNFDFLWYSKGSCPSYAGYGGPYAASEPETQAMQKLINDTDFKIFASLHTQGQVIYWMDPNCNQNLIGKFESHIDRICKETGFDKMPSDGTHGYSGYMTDYVRYYKEAMAMTIELCPYVGDYPYPESDFDTIAYPIRNIGLILADIAKYL